MLDLKLALGCMIFISYTIVSIFTRILYMNLERDYKFEKSTIT